MKTHNYDGQERRSDERLKFEDIFRYNPSSAVVFFDSVQTGVKRRISEILTDRSTDNRFSLSASDVLHFERGNIAFDQGVVVVNDEEDPYGKALSHRSKPKEWHNSLSEDDYFTEPNHLSLMQTPDIIIPKTPIHPAHVHYLAVAGNLQFEYLPTKTMMISLPTAIDTSKNEYEWKLHFVPTSDIATGTTSNNYGQGIFDGAQAIVRYDGTIVFVGMSQHANRFSSHGERMALPPVPSDIYERTSIELIKANREYLDHNIRGYLRMVECAFVSQLGVKRNKQPILTCEFVPIGTIFNKALHLKVEDEFRRSAVNGVGWVKAFGNYAPTFVVKEKAIDEGFDDLLYLNNDRFIGEASSSNVCFITKGVNPILIMPSVVSGEVLNGITAQFIEQIGEELVEQGLLWDVRRGDIFSKELEDMDEAFLSGTGVGMNGIASFDLSGVPIPMQKLAVNEEGKALGPISHRIFQRYNEVLYKDKSVFDRGNRYYGWLRKVEL